MKRIAILGGGYGGVAAALKLHKKLRKEKDVEIMLIDQNEHHTLLTELHEVAGNRVEEDAVLIPFKKIFEYTKVKVVKDKITRFNFDESKIASDTREYSYDYLIIATGSEPAYYGIEGMKEHAFTLWSHEDAVRIKRHIEDCFAAAGQEKDPVARQRLLTFVVGGGGFTGIEMIGELAAWKNELCHRYGVQRSEVRLIVVEALPRILPVLKDNLAEKAEKYLVEKLDVELLTDCPITKVTPDAVELKGQSTIPTNTVIWTGGVKASETAEKTGLKAANRCRLQVNEYLQTSHANVYAIGDNALCESNGSALPALVEAALETGECAANNIIADIKGREPKPCKAKLHGVMVSIGRWYGVADLMGIQLSGFLAIFMKHLVNLHYLFGIAGVEVCLRYLAHEFLREREDKNFIDIHLQVRWPSIFLVPLRVYLGYMWLMQGIHKYQDGWLKQVVLTAKAAGESVAAAADTATSASAAASTAADAATSASTAAGSAAADTGAALMNLIGENTPGWYAWIAENIVVPNAMIFQWMVVLTEIGLGLAFITGTLTFIAAFVSIVMNVNFILSTGVYDYWYLISSIAMFAGAGQIWGLDYYLMPYLMRQWRYFVRNKRINPFLFRGSGRAA